MKRFILFSSLVVLLAACQTTASTNKEEKEKAVSLEIPDLHQRSGALASAAEWPKTQEKVQELKTNLEKNPSDTKSRLQIATIYIAEARITGEHPYYYPAILKILDGVIYFQPDNFDALVLKASVKLSQHQFKEAREIAEKARSLNPANAYVYGILVDANVELGNYDEAISNSDKMQQLKPSLESYARASYLREIHGDLPGAIAAMKLAVQAGLPGSEPQCWSRNSLADLYRRTGDLKSAEAEYRANLEMRPSYAFSLAGLAKVEQQKKNYDKALTYLEQAVAILPEFSFHEQMADIYVLQGNADRAMHKYHDVADMLSEDEASGHDVGLEYANLFMKLDEVDKAERYALKEYERRSSNIDVNQTLAWIAYRKNDRLKANQYLQVASRTGSRDPQLLERAEQIRKM